MRTVIVKQDVRRLDVSMRHTALVNEMKAKGGLGHDPDGVFQITLVVHPDQPVNELDLVSPQECPAPLDHLLERGPLDERHSHVEEAVDITKFEYRQERRASQPGPAFGLSPELCQAM